MNGLRFRFRRDFTGQRGMVSFATLIALLFLAVFAALVFNAGQTVTRKLETQNAADAVAYSSSVWVARGMNAITAANHMMGELTALYVLHHSLGGRWLDEHSLDEKNGDRLTVVNTGLQVTYYMAQASPATIRPASQPYEKVKENPCASYDSTLYQAKAQLKIILAAAYFSHHLAGWGEWAFPPFTIVPGKIAQAIALVAEWKVYQEYLVLDGVEMLAQSTKMMAHSIAGVDQDGNTRTGVLDALDGYEDVIRAGVIIQAQLCATKVANRQGAEGAVRGDVPDSLSLGSLEDFTPRLPIEQHEYAANTPPNYQTPGNPPAPAFPLFPINSIKAGDADYSQLMRSTYPWVCRWRKPIRTFFLVSATISGASGYYGDYTNIYSRHAVRWMRLNESQNYDGFHRYGMGRKGKDFRLYVVEGLNDTLPGANGFHKSQEEWNKPGSSRTSEPLFTHMGFARIEQPSIGVPAVYRQENPDGFVCFSQSMIYNANQQQAPAHSRGGGDPQPKVGWDTLNWTANAIEYPTNADLSNDPKIKLNWQARLTPVTPLKLTGTAVTTLAGDMAGPLQRSIPALYLNNH